MKLVLLLLASCSTGPSNVPNPPEASPRAVDARRDPVAEPAPRAPTPTDSPDGLPWFSLTTGWCSSDARPPSRTTTTLEVDPQSGRVRPLRRGGFPREEMGWSRHERAYELGQTPFFATLEHGEIRFTRPEARCEDTNAGCFHLPPGASHVLRHAWTVYREPVPAERCIRFFDRAPAGFVLGLDDEIRTYLERPDGTLAPSARLPAPALTLIAIVEGVLVLTSDASLSGPGVPREARALWRLRWISSTDRPELAASDLGARVERVLDARWNARLDLLAFTAGGLIAVDRESFAVRWRYSGDVRSLLLSYVPEGFVVSVVEPTARGSQVRVVWLDEHGRELRAYVAHDGDAIVDAQLGRYDERTLLVHLSR